MGWPEIRSALDAQLIALRHAGLDWTARRTELSETTTRAHHVLDGAVSAAPREALAHLHAAKDTGAPAGPKLAEAATAIEKYLKAVDPDNAAGSAAGVPAPTEIGDEHGGHGGPGVPGARKALTGGWRKRSHVFTEQGGPAGFADFVARGGALLAFQLQWLLAAGHVLDRHGPALTDHQLRARARNGIDPITGTRTDWERGSKHKYGRHATAFTSAQSLAYAEMRVHDSRANQERRNTADADDELQYQIAVPAEWVFGADFRTHLRGWGRVGSKEHPQGTQPTIFPDSTHILVVYARSDTASEWVAYTCYPMLSPPGDG